MRSSARKRKPRSSKDEELLPLHTKAPQAASSPDPRRLPTKPRRRRRAGRRRQSAAAVISLLLALLLITIYALDRIWVYLSLSSYPRYLPHRTATIPIHRAKIAVVSIHEGFKYHGRLGQFLRNNKQTYAGAYGYSYADTFPAENELAPLQWQLQENRAVYYKKPRFLLRLMEKYTNLEWLLWIDGDAIVTQPYISIEDRIEQFESMHTGTEDICLVWAEDSQPNAGVLLFRNSPTGRALLKRALNTWDDTDEFRKFTDQASLTAAVQNNSTYHECQLLLRTGRGEQSQSTLLQSRVRGPSSWTWQPGHWILHLPNHNYLELLSSLKMVGKQLERSPPPIFPPLERPSIASLSKTRRERFEAVQGAIRHAWRGYAHTCLHSSGVSKYLGSHIPCDDLSPLAGAGHDWLFHSATLHDSLDTLAIAFGPDSHEYTEALDVILGVDLQATALRPTKTFEYSLRIVGGLLGAFSISGDVRLLSRAKDAADALLQGPFASSPTVLPRMYDVLFPPRGGSFLYRIYSRLYEWGRDVFTTEHHFNSLAGLGSFALEFYFLSQMLGDSTYKQAADDIFLHVAKYQARDGTVPSSWNVMSGEPITNSGGLGSGSDSFLEYLLKVPLLACASDGDTLACREEGSVLLKMLELYGKIVQGPLRSKHIKKGSDASIAYPMDNSRYHQLLCFLPGMIALGASSNITGKARLNNEDDFALAGEILQGCHGMYSQTATGLGPEEVLVNQRKEVDLTISKLMGDRSYLLRPEYIESLFMLYRLSGKQEYQEMGWEVFESLEHYCKTDLGYTGLKDVYEGEDGGRIDDMPSYFIAESLKYLLLLFGPDDYLPLDEFVFTTEAHPVRRKQTRLPSAFVQAEVSRFIVQAPFPWYFFGGDGNPTT